MGQVLVSERHELGGYGEAVEWMHAAGWTDGLPVIPPTEAAVRSMLDAARLEPDAVIAEIPERGRVITAEKVAINTVMAGGTADHLPVVVAALEAVTDRRFWFNHLASLGSPWPLMIVNGPVAESIGLYSGGGLFGPGHRANLVIARSVSLVLRNCAGARADQGVERAQWGNPLRLVGCIAENEDVHWDPLHVQRGHDPADSTITVVSCYPGSPGHVRVPDGPPERVLDVVCHAMVNWGGSEWSRGPYVLLMGPHMAEMFHDTGWSKDRVRDHIFDHAVASVADLKRRDAWGKWVSLPEAAYEVQSEDEAHLVHLLKANPEDDHLLFMDSTLEDRDVDVLIVVAGGDTGYRMELAVPYQASANAVTKKIRTSTES